MPLMIPPTSATVSLPHPSGIGWVPLGDVVAGVPVEVPEWAVGEAPDARREFAAEELNALSAPSLHAERAKRRDELIDLPAGSGLLAQGWTLAPAAEPKNTTKKEQAS